MVLDLREEDPVYAASRFINLCTVSRVQYLLPCDVGVEETEHGVRSWEINLRSYVKNQCGWIDASTAVVGTKPLAHAKLITMRRESANRN